MVSGHERNRSQITAAAFTGRARVDVQDVAEESGLAQRRRIGFLVARRPAEPGTMPPPGRPSGVCTRPRASTLLYLHCELRRRQDVIAAGSVDCSLSARTTKSFRKLYTSGSFVESGWSRLRNGTPSTLSSLASRPDAAIALLVGDQPAVQTMRLAASRSLPLFSYRGQYAASPFTVSGRPVTPGIGTSRRLPISWKAATVPFAALSANR
jgi:hypothetical protein